MGRAEQRQSDEKTRNGRSLRASGTILIVALAMGFFACADEKPKKQPEKAAPPPKTGNELFEVKPPQIDDKDPRRVTDGEPRTVDMEVLKKHLGHLYLEPETAKRIEALNTEVERFRKERWHISNELSAEYKALTNLTSSQKHDSFLERADDELSRINLRFEKSDMVLKDANGNFYPSAFSGFVYKPYVFFVQNQGGQEAEIAERIHGELLQLKEAFDAYFGQFLDLKPNPKHGIIYVMLLRSFADYQTYNRVTEPAKDNLMTLAHYEPRNHRLVVPLTYGNRLGQKDDAAQRHQAREVMFHEGTHQLLHYYSTKEGQGDHLSAYGSMWSDEGVAEFFGGHEELPDGKFAFGRINSRVESVASDGNDVKQRLPLVELTRWTRFLYEKMKNEGQANFAKADSIHLHVYSQGWGLVHFLNNYKNGIYKKQFQEIMRRQIETGDSGMPVFRSVFGADFDKVEGELNAYLDAMTDALRKKAISIGSAFTGS